MTTSGITEQQDGIRTAMHGMWAAVAGAWGTYADEIEERWPDGRTAMLDAAGVRVGDRVLELACGPGGLGLAAAERVGADGHVVVSDVAAPMTAIAAERARAAGLSNVTTAVRDLERIDEPDGAFDVVLCREGLMFALEPERAAGEICRVLRPGGRVALAVWGPRERNPWLGTVMDAVSGQLGVPVPPPGLPGPFALADAGRLEMTLTRAGLAGVDVREVAVPMRVESFEVWWSRTVALSGPMAKLVETQPPETLEAIRARARDAAGRFAVAGGLDFPGVTLLASGRRD